MKINVEEVPMIPVTEFQRGVKRMLIRYAKKKVIFITLGGIPVAEVKVLKDNLKKKVSRSK